MSGPQARAGIFRFQPNMRELPLVDGDRCSTLLASNECALGPSPRAIEAAREALAHAHLYPENAEVGLCAAIADRFDLDERRIVCGHGSDDLLARVARAYLRPGEELIYSAGGYQKFVKYALMENAVPVAATDQDLRTDVDAIITKVTKQTRIVMLANPDNPSGISLPGSEVRRLHSSLPENVLLVLDSAYAEYVSADDYESPRKLVETAGNVVMTRTFSKIFGLAGARLGWLYGPSAVVEAVRAVGVTYAITAASAAAGIAALEDRDHTQAVRTHTEHWRSWLSAELESPDLTVFPSQANFVLVRFETSEMTAQSAYDFLIGCRIVPRLFFGKKFANLMRITIGPENDLKCLVAALQEFREMRREAPNQEMTRS